MMSEGYDLKQLGKPKWQGRFQIMTNTGKRASLTRPFPEKKDMVALRTP